MVSTLCIYLLICSLQPCASQGALEELVQSLEKRMKSVLDILSLIKCHGIEINVQQVIGNARLELSRDICDSDVNLEPL